MAYIPLTPEEENNDAAWYTAGAAGIASGIFQIPKGVFSLAAELIDLGLDTNTAGKVEQFFDTFNPFDELAQKHGAGRLTEALVSIGIPSTIGFKLGSKLAKKALDARKAGTSFRVGSRNAGKQAQRADKLNKLIPTTPGGEEVARFAAGVAGGAAGEAFVADVEEIGTFGDMFESAPTELDRYNSEGREDATRKLMNRFKFASEGLLITPFVGAAAKGGKALAQRGKDLAYSSSKFDRAVAKIASVFTPKGKLTDEIFGSQKAMEYLKSVDSNRATEIVRNLTKSVDKSFPEMQKVMDKLITPKEKKEFYGKLNDLLFEGDVSKGLLDPKKVDSARREMRALGVTEETSGNIMNSLREARAHFSELASLTQGKKSEITDILKDRISKMVGNTYRIFEDKPIMGIFNRYKASGESINNAISYFKTQLAKKDIARVGPPGPKQYENDARQIVNNLVAEATRVGKVGDLPNLDFMKGTLASRKLGYKEITEATDQPIKVIRDLFGEI